MPDPEGVMDSSTPQEHVGGAASLAGRLLYVGGTSMLWRGEAVRAGLPGEAYTESLREGIPRSLT